MNHFEPIYDIFCITVRKLIRDDVNRLTMPSPDAKGQECINAGEALKNKIDMITKEEWDGIHK